MRRAGPSMWPGCVRLSAGCSVPSPRGFRRRFDWDADRTLFALGVGAHISLTLIRVLLLARQSGSCFSRVSPCVLRLS